MAGTPRGTLAALCAALFVTTPALGFGGRWGNPSVQVTACAPATVWQYHVPVAAPWHAAPSFPTQSPMRSVIPAAKPTPAPPSGNVEPPLNPRRAPTVTESRSFSGADPARAVEVAPGRCKVGFWNVTGADVILTVDGQTRTLAKDRAVTLDLARTFVWQIRGRAPHTERVADNQNLHEVILRP